MQRSLAVGLVVLLTASFASAANVYNFNPAFDAGDSDGVSDQWGYTCERGNYQAWFGFDVSAIPNGELITQASFQGYLYGTGWDVERSCWYESDDAWIGAMTNPGDKALTELVGTVTENPAGLYTFNLDLSGHDWQNDLVDNYVSLMVTGPLNNDHICGEIYFTESGFLPVLTIVTDNGTPVAPAPGALVLGALGTGIAGWLRRRRAL